MIRVEDSLGKLPMYLSYCRHKQICQVPWQVNAFNYRIAINDTWQEQGTTYRTVNTHIHGVSHGVTHPNTHNFCSPDVFIFNVIPFKIPVVCITFPLHNTVHLKIKAVSAEKWFFFLLCSNTVYTYLYTRWRVCVSPWQCCVQLSYTITFSLFLYTCLISSELHPYLASLSLWLPELINQAFSTALMLTLRKETSQWSWDAATWAPGSFWPPFP